MTDQSVSDLQEKDDRELLGIATLADGSKFNVHNPKVRDIVGMSITDEDFLYKLAAKAINISYEEYLEWDIVDHFEVMAILNDAIEAFASKRVLGEKP